MCNEVDGHKYVTVTESNGLQLPTKRSWALHHLPSHHGLDFKKIHLVTDNCCKAIYHAVSLPALSKFETRLVSTGKFTQLPGCLKLKLYDGKHVGLEHHTACIMKAVHRMFYCNMGVLEERFVPHNLGNSFSMYPPSNAGAFVHEKTAFGTRVCLIHERSGKWNIPSGGIDPHQNGHAAAIRELSEETSGVVKFTSRRSYDSIQLNSFYLLFVEVHNNFWSDATTEFDRLCKMGKLGQRETINMKWIFVYDLASMAICKELRGCFASLLHMKGMRQMLRTLGLV
ncbi:hypothetical protein T484DRAFT_1757448 [Baffinella frigidus]|nr:hypothetical protein T484DRAFT_1757448 [Cryptophyta sp. CCMP2293]